MHLAARFHFKCLFKLLEFDSEHLKSSLLNDQDNEMKLSPLHISAIAEVFVGTR